MTVEVQPMWLPLLIRAVSDGSVDVAITCGLVDSGPRVVSEVFCAEPLRVGLRRSHRLAGRAIVAVTELAHDVLGAPQPNLFPAWALVQQQALTVAGISPPTIELVETDLSARGWEEQSGVDWILLVPSLLHGERSDVIIPVEPEILVPYTVQWVPERRPSAAGRFVHCALTAELPQGWRARPSDVAQHDGDTGSRHPR